MLPPQSVPVAVILPVKNEALNLAKCLASLAPAAQVLVIDSASVDGTVELARQAGRFICQFAHTGRYPKKRQWALDHLEIQHDWVLFVDADEEVPSDLWREIQGVVTAPPKNDAYLIRKGFHFLGRKFRFGGFSFAAVLLARREKIRFEQLLEEEFTALDMEVHERVIVKGTVGQLQTPLIHDDFKSLEAYLDRHNRYSSWEAKVRCHFLETGQWGSDAIVPKLWGNAQERRRFLKRLAMRVPLEPWLWFCYHFFLRAGFLEGRRGWIACTIRAQYIAQVRAKVYEQTLKGRR